ncbi:MAG: hypothetical protein ACP5JS_01015 [Fervidobacterium sp.]
MYEKFRKTLDHNSFICFFVIALAGNVQINGRVEFKYTISPTFSLPNSNWFASDNAAYLVITSSGAVLVADIKYTAPNITSAYINELFIPWKANNNLTVFFGYRNIADYDSFLGNNGSLKWGKNGIGILWYKSVISFVYGANNIYIDGGTSFNANSITSTDFAILVKTSFYPFNIAFNVNGVVDFSYGLLGTRISYNLRPFTLYVAAGYEYTDNELLGLLLGFSAELPSSNLIFEVDASDFTNIKFYGDGNYKVGNYKIGSSGTYALGSGAYEFDPYIATKFGNADAKFYGVIKNSGFHGATLSVSFGL